MSANKCYMNRINLSGLPMIKTGQRACDIGFEADHKSMMLQGNFYSVWLLREKVV
jgi:hypothetical protein